MTPDTSGDDATQIAIARAIATIGHRDQVDKLGDPYINHPARVANRLRGRLQAVAWLHDVVEDCKISADDLLRAGVDADIVEAVELLTRTPAVTPDDYYAAIRANEIARIVKLADLDDNTDPARTKRLEPAIRERLALKYAKARAALGQKEDAL